MVAGACGPSAPPVDVVELARGNGPDPETLDIHRARSEPALNILRDLYDGLVGETSAGTPEPGVATSWQWSTDGLELVFELRDTARWSNGDPVVADDFVFAFRRLVDPATASPYATMLAPLAGADEIVAGAQPPDHLGIRADGSHRLVMHFARPAPYLLQALTHPSTFPMHRPSFDTHGARFAKPGHLVSNGAYRLTEWVVGSHVTADRNTHSWRDDVAIDRVRYLHIADESSELKRFRAGELHLTYTVPSRQIDAMRAAYGDQLKIGTVLNTYFYGFNVTREPFADNPGLRKALSMAVDRERLVNRITGAGERPAYALVPPGTANYTVQSPPWVAWDTAKRHAEARRLYAEAGYGDEEPLAIEVRYNASQLHERIAVAVAAMWRDVLGVETRLYAEEWKVFVQNRRAREVTEIFRAGWIADYNDAQNFAQLLASDSPLNDSGWSNAAYDTLLRAAGAETRTDERRRLLEHAERLAQAEQPLMPLYYYVSRHLVSPRVAGWTHHPLDRHDTRHLALVPADGG